MGSLGTANETVHAAAFAEKGVIAAHVPLTSMYGATLLEGMLQLYARVTARVVLVDAVMFTTSSFVLLPGSRGSAAFEVSFDTEILVPALSTNPTLAPEPLKLSVCILPEVTFVEVFLPL